MRCPLSTVSASEEGTAYASMMASGSTLKGTTQPRQRRALPTDGAERHSSASPEGRHLVCDGYDHASTG